MTKTVGFLGFRLSFDNYCLSLLTKLRILLAQAELSDD
jgi:hypothetical protein